MQKKFDEFRRDVNAGMERYTAANGLARRLVAEGHSDTVLIKEKQDSMRWEIYYSPCGKGSAIFCGFITYGVGYLHGDL